MNRKAKGTNRLVAAVLAVLMLFMTGAPALAETFSAIVTSGSMTVYKNQALTTKADALAKNTIVRVTSYSGKAARISYSGKTGYAKVSLVAEHPDWKEAARLFRGYIDDRLHQEKFAPPLPD